MSGSNSKTFRYLDELNGSYFIGSVRIRVLQKSAEPGATIDMVVIDQKGTTMNVKIMNAYAELFINTLKENVIYDVTRFSTAQAKLFNRPTRHERVMFLNNNTTVDTVQDIVGFPTRRSFKYIDLNEAIDIVRRQDNTYLLDVIGIVVYVSTVTAYSSDKLKRVIGIQDNTGAIIKIVLWNEYAADFEQLEISDKSVLALASVSVNRFKGFEEESLTTSRFTQLLVDSQTPRALELKKSDNYSELQERVALMDWRVKNRKSLFDIISDFEPNKNEESYTCIAEIIGHSGVIPYLACKNCNTKCPEKCSSFLCNRCKLQTSTHNYCRIETRISDKTATEVVTLFGNQLEIILKIKLPKLVDLLNDSKKSSELYTLMLGKNFVFELKPQVYTTSLKLTVNKIGEVVNSETVLANQKGKRKITVITEEQLHPSTPSKVNSSKKRQRSSRKAGEISQLDLSPQSELNVVAEGDNEGNSTVDK